MKIEVSGDQNTVTVDDVAYVASPQKKSCQGCAFDQGLYCAVPAAPCMASKRKAGVSAIFIKSDVQPTPIAVLASEMTLRDYFAAKAMQAMCEEVVRYDDFKGCAKNAYRMADEMMAARGA